MNGSPYFVDLSCAATLSHHQRLEKLQYLIWAPQWLGLSETRSAARRPRARHRSTCRSGERISREEAYLRATRERRTSPAPILFGRDFHFRASVGGLRIRWTITPAGWRPCSTMWARIERTRTRSFRSFSASWKTWTTRRARTNVRAPPSPSPSRKNIRGLDADKFSISIPRSSRPDSYS